MTRLDMAAQIYRWEARLDSSGHLKVYKLPSNDGGGTFEVAGINDRYHPEMATRLKGMIEHGRAHEAETEAIEYLAQYTDKAAKWTTLPAVELFLRDCIFNRGPGGAAKILQMAVRAEPVDGGVGPITLAAAAPYEKKPILFLARLRVAREAYERGLPSGIRANFAAGLANRWDKALEAAVDVFAA